VDGKYPRPQQTTNTTSQLRARLDQECLALEQYIEQQKSQLEQLENSDRALYRQELEEEARILHQERLRQQDLQVELQIALTEAKRELSQLLETEGPATYERQRRKIEELQEKLKKYDDANTKLSAKLKARREQRESEGTRVRDNSAEVDSLKDQIAAMQKEIASVDEKIATAKRNHDQAMRDLQNATDSRRAGDDSDT
jgi:chromosome segregation ATPase